MLSFNGHIIESIKATNYEWIMFYPCIYTFAIWDAYKDAGGHNSGYSFLPAVFGAYLGTLGVVFSRETISMAMLLGPIWFGILGMLTGAAVGLLLKVSITNSTRLRSLMSPTLVPKKNN
ncbi:hypothetical protein SDC9_146080 [bioreactor metagenome]|uniref:Uncharacterized protein n=1 Tax=bioreactor metagenome TaxID=1076179 RepID=A0A645EAQ7_9ZZZZ